MLVSILVGALAACEPWCSHPCGELNGHVKSECGECDASNKCWPGAPGFNNHDPTTSRNMVVDADGEVQAQGAYGSHGNPIQMPSGYFDTFVTGACDLESVDASTVTREMLNQADKPFLIKGLTRDWKAHKSWALDSLLERHGDVPFQLHATVGPYQRPTLFPMGLLLSLSHFPGGHAQSHWGCLGVLPCVCHAPLGLRPYF